MLIDFFMDSNIRFPKAINIPVRSNGSHVGEISACIFLTLKTGPKIVGLCEPNFGS